MYDLLHRGPFCCSCSAGDTVVLNIIACPISERFTFSFLIELILVSFPSSWTVLTYSTFNAPVAFLKIAGSGLESHLGSCCVLFVRYNSAIKQEKSVEHMKFLSLSPLSFCSSSSNYKAIYTQQNFLYEQPDLFVCFRTKSITQ